MYDGELSSLLYIGVFLYNSKISELNICNNPKRIRQFATIVDIGESKLEMMVQRDWNIERRVQTCEI